MPNFLEVWVCKEEDIISQVWEMDVSSFSSINIFAFSYSEKSEEIPGIRYDDNLIRTEKSSDDPYLKILKFTKFLGELFQY